MYFTQSQPLLNTILGLYCYIQSSDLLLLYSKQSETLVLVCKTQRKILLQRIYILYLGHQFHSTIFNSGQKESESFMNYLLVGQHKHLLTFRTLFIALHCYYFFVGFLMFAIISTQIKLSCHLVSTFRGSMLMQNDARFSIKKLPTTQKR